MKRFWDWVDQRLIVRRFTLVWACSLITIVSLRATDHLDTITAAGATVVTAVVGILTTVLAFYMRTRQTDEN